MRVGEKRILNIDEGREVVKERSGGTQSGGGRRVPELWHTKWRRTQSSEESV